MLKQLKRMMLVCCVAAFSFASAMANDIHVDDTKGNDTNPGTEAAPLKTIHQAMKLVQPGDRILVHEGTYYITERIKVPALETTPELRCELRAWPNDAVGKVIIDGSKVEHNGDKNTFKQARCIYVNHEVNYWTFYGLILQNAKDNGMKLEGSYNVVERCTFRWNNDTGLQVGMYKDFSIEETKSFPIQGEPEFNPNFTYCRYNQIINCDSYQNADAVEYNGDPDNGGDADGFACKLFPGPGNEFHGCRAWDNSDDGWDLFMVYHPVVIDHCWSYHAGYYMPPGVPTTSSQNGNGFKLGGSKEFQPSVGAHVVTNCVTFGNKSKGFDQNSGAEGMYIINCVSWDNIGNNYAFSQPTYGNMVAINNIGWGTGCSFGAGASLPTNSFNKAGIYYPSQFQSLAVEDFKAERQEDGSLPDNGFARLVKGSEMIDQGTPIVDFEPKRFMTEDQALKAGHVEYVQVDNLNIPYNGDKPDLGAFETEGTPADVRPNYLKASIDKEEGISTFCPKYGVDLTYETEIAAYSGTVQGSTVKLTRVYKVAPGEGVLIRSLFGGKVTRDLPVKEHIAKNEGNEFVGTLDDIEHLGASNEDGTMAHYVLYKPTNGFIGFYRAGADTKVPAGKAYLPIEITASNAKELNITFGDNDATGVIAIPTSNGQATGETIFSLSGQRVAHPTKGIYIVNGKKVVIK